MQFRPTWLVAFIILCAAASQAQPLIRLTEDLRSVTSEAPGFSMRSDAPDPAFEDPLVDLGDRVADANGRIEGAVSQITFLFDRFQHDNSNEAGHRLSADSQINIHGTGHPLHDVLIQESRWIMRFELARPCTVRLACKSQGRGEREFEFRLRRFDGATWVTLFEYVSGQGDSGSFTSVLADVGGQYEVSQRNRLRGQAPAGPQENRNSAQLLADFIPFQSTWARWSRFNGGNDHWYRAVRAGAPIDRDAAALFAATRGGYLASITSATENAFVFSRIDEPAFWHYQSSQYNGPWLGATQQPGASEPAGGWQWDGGEPFVYSNWAAGQPNDAGGDERYLNFYCGPCLDEMPTWNDHDSAIDGSFDDRPFAFVVEYNDPPCPDFDESGWIDLPDLAALLAAYGRSGGAPFASGDCNGDGDVELDDLSLLLSAFGGPCR